MSNVNGKNGSSSTTHPSGDARFKLVDRAIKRHQNRPDALIEVLHTAQEAFGYLAEDLIVYVSRELKVPLAKVYGVATFYDHYRLHAPGHCLIRFCNGLPCKMRGADRIAEHFSGCLGISNGETTPDGEFTFEFVECLGACNIAPLVLTNNGLYSRLTEEKVDRLLSSWQRSTGG